MISKQFSLDSAQILMYKGKNNFTQFNVAKAKLLRHDRVDFYLATLGF